MNQQSVTDYLQQLLLVSSIADCIEKIRLERNDCIRFDPQMFVINSAGAVYAGVSYGYAYSQISSWILVDTEQAMLVVRHELAHLIHAYSGVGGTPHGKEYNAVLRIVAGKGWRMDKHWIPNPVIEKARGKCHKTQARFLVNRS